MKRLFVYLLILNSFTVFLSCSDKIDIQLEQKKLFQEDLKFALTSLEKGAAEAFRLFLTENALQLPSGGQAVFGRKTIYENMKQAPPSFILEWEPQKAEVAGSGDLGYTWGTYTSTYKDKDGMVKKTYGKYLNIWKKQNDGSWKVLIDMGNQNPEPKKI